MTEISFLDTANLPNSIDKKVSFVDINCFNQAQNHYIIEMQLILQFYFLAGAQYYTS